MDELNGVRAQPKWITLAMTRPRLFTALAHHLILSPEYRGEEERLGYAVFRFANRTS
jgi:hypothetical protein